MSFPVSTSELTAGSGGCVPRASSSAWRIVPAALARMANVATSRSWASRKPPGGLRRRIPQLGPSGADSHAVIASSCIRAGSAPAGASDSDRPLSIIDLDHVLDRAADDLARWRGARLLLTGATGFVGSWLLDTLLHANE